jgi:hypothetical protein
MLLVTLAQRVLGDLSGLKMSGSLKTVGLRVAAPAAREMIVFEVSDVCYFKWENTPPGIK